MTFAALEPPHWSFAPESTVEIGGVTASCKEVVEALDCLKASSGLMIKQPLARIGNPLSACNYLAVSAPHRRRFSDSQGVGRGAAGRHLAKLAFCYALEQALEEVTREPERGFSGLLEDAYAALEHDHTYSAAMARAAVAIRSKRHGWELRAQLRQAAHQAVSACDARKGEFTCEVETACGTGGCRFASDQLALLTGPAPAGRMARPDNHVRPGDRFSPDEAVPALERVVRFRVAE